MSVEAELVAKFQALIRSRYDDVGPASRERLFADYDANSDGLIDAEELKAILVDAEIGNALTRGMWVKGVIARMDTDGDGHISLPEFEAVISAAKQAKT